jgi:hypothetical protein
VAKNHPYRLNLYHHFESRSTALVGFVVGFIFIGLGLGMTINALNKYQDKFLPGTYLDETYLTNLTPEEALYILEADQPLTSFYTVTLESEGIATSSSSAELSLRQVFQPSLDEAFAYGHTGGWWQRLRDLWNSSFSDRIYSSKWQYDPSSLEQLESALAEVVNTPSRKPHATLRTSGYAGSLSIDAGLVGRAIDPTSSGKYCKYRRSTV